MEKTVVLASGGLFSTVTACRAAVDSRTHLLFANWGQEGAAARRQAVSALANHLNCGVTAVDLPFVRQIEGGDEASAIRAPGSAPRLAGVNLAMIAAGLNLAEAIEATQIHMGASESRTDRDVAHHRREYIYLANHLLEELTPPSRRVVLKAPLIDLSPAEIVKLGHRLQTPFAHTHSCKAATDAPCGECIGCRTRQLAFGGANLADPLLSHSSS